MTSARYRNNRRGFTLAELLAVLVIMMIVAGVGVPATTGWLRLQRLQDAVDGLRTDWIKARTLAMDEGRAYRFHVLPNQTGYRIAPDESQFWPEHASGVNAPPSAGDEEPGAWV